MECDLLEAIERLEADVAALVAAPVPVETPTVLHDVVRRVGRLADLVEAARARVVGAWDGCGVWADDGSRSSAARLSRMSRCHPHTATTVVGRARRLDAMPQVRAAFEAGEITVDHVDALARLNTGGREDRFAAAEDELVEFCRTLNWRDLRRALGYWRTHADAERNDPQPSPADTATVHLSATFEGIYDLRGTLGPVEGRILELELDRLLEHERRDDLREGRDRTPAQRRAAALVTMARRSSVASKGRAARPLFTVLLGHSSFERLCELSSGAVVTPQDLVPYIDSAVVETVLFDGPHTVVSVSHKRRFTGALRRAIQVRDRHCQHLAGCHVGPEGCDIDHIVPRHLGGPTSQSNGRLECDPHNRNPDKHDPNQPQRPDHAYTAVEAARLRARYLHTRDPPP